MAATGAASSTAANEPPTATMPPVIWPQSERAAGVLCAAIRTLPPAVTCVRLPTIAKTAPTVSGSLVIAASILSECFDSAALIRSERSSLAKPSRPPDRSSSPLIPLRALSASSCASSPKPPPIPIAEIEPPMPANAPIAYPLAYDTTSWVDWASTVTSPPA